MTKHIPKQPSRGGGAKALVALLWTTLIATADAGPLTAYIKGIGYREQSLQQAKGEMIPTGANGIEFASFGGGTHIFIESVHLSETIAQNQVLFECPELQNSGMLSGPPLSSDDIFNSNPTGASGPHIAYRLPTLSELIGIK